jgi:hypothetical protein
MQLRLNTLQNSRKSYARVIREYAQGKIEEKYARTLAYLLTGFLSYWKEEREGRVEAKLDELMEHYRGGKM